MFGNGYLQPLDPSLIYFVSINLIPIEGFFNLRTMDVTCGWVILSCGVLSVHCRTLSSMPGLCHFDASNITLPFVKTKNIPGYYQMFCEGQGSSWLKTNCLWTSGIFKHPDRFFWSFLDCITCSPATSQITLLMMMMMMMMLLSTTCFLFFIIFIISIATYKHMLCKHLSLPVQVHRRQPLSCSITLVPLPPAHLIIHINQKSSSPSTSESSSLMLFIFL